VCLCECVYINLLNTNPLFLFLQISSNHSTNTFHNQHGISNHCKSFIIFIYDNLSSHKRCTKFGVEMLGNITSIAKCLVVIKHFSVSIAKRITTTKCFGTSDAKHLAATRHFGASVGKHLVATRHFSVNTTKCMAATKCSSMNGAKYLMSTMCFHANGVKH